MKKADPYAEWDGAYVLGALSPTERREFERHLLDCPSCAAGVAQLAGVPGLLAKVPVEDAITPPPASEIPVPATLLPRLVRSARRRSIRTRALVAGGIVAAAAAAAAVVLVLSAVLVPTSPAPPPAEVSTDLALSQVVPSDLSANIHMVAEGWGTRIKMACRYGQGAGAPTDPGSSYGSVPGASYAMFVTGADGKSAQIATWTATPGSTVEPWGTTSLAISEIRSVEVRSASDGQVLLVGNP